MTTTPDAHQPAYFMDADTFQGLSIRTDWPDWNRCRDEGIIHAALGLASEAGEVAGLCQKWYGQGHDLDREQVMAELGDVLWFAAKLARCLDIPLSHIMAANVAKLARRYPDGWSAELSMRRVDEGH